MTPPSSYAEAIAFLQGLQRFGARLGLDTMLRLVGHAGHPERSLRFVHVAGTNGKGSTCAFLEAILRESGRKTGLYTSPHLVSFRERIQVNRACIPALDVARLCDRVRHWVGDGSPPVEVSFFEFVTVIALCWFQEQACDVVVWETGLGGRLDATNIVTPLASVITNIGLDHTEWLGPTTGAIAREKAGIIKPGVPVLTAVDEDEPLSVIRQTATEREAPLTIVTAGDGDFELARSVALPLAGDHQVVNAALASATARRLGIDERVIRRALPAARWPGRFEVFQRAEQSIVLDGAHNPPAFEALAATLRQKFPAQSYALVLGMLADKDQRAAAARLVPGAARTLVVPLQTPRGGDTSVLARICSEFSDRRPVGLAKGFAEAIEALGGENLIVVTGSLYLVGEALEWLSGAAGNERALNDWGPMR